MNILFLVMESNGRFMMETRKTEKVFRMSEASVEKENVSSYVLDSNSFAGTFLQTLKLRNLIAFLVLIPKLKFIGA